jgi:Flp pilus assembly protein TadB
MENELLPDHLKTLWQNQHTEHVQMSLTEIRHNAQRFQRKIRNRNLREYVAAIFVFVVFSYFAWRFPPMRLGCALTIAGTLYVMYQLYTRGAAKTVPEAVALSACIDFHRRELERQRDLAREVWTWYLLPIIPGPIAVVAVPLWHSPPEHWVRALPFMILLPTTCYVTWRLNKRGADKLQRQIDDLNAIDRE